MRAAPPGFLGSEGEKPAATVADPGGRPEGMTACLPSVVSAGAGRVGGGERCSGVGEVRGKHAQVPKSVTDCQVLSLQRS